MIKSFFLLAAVLLIAGCVNVHVHFPASPAEPAPAAGDNPSTKVDKPQ